MIERYSRPEMKKVWSEQNKFDKWLQVELAVCEAWTQVGIIPSEDMIKLRNARYNELRLNEILVKTKHDMTAFLQSITEQLGDESRWIHWGLTSNDVWDTATCLQMVDACNLLKVELNSLANILRSKAILYKDTLMMGRTHGVHAEPLTFGLKLAVWWSETGRNLERLSQAFESISVGKISGAVGTHATVPPNIEKIVCKQLGLKVATVSNQIVQRDRHAHLISTFAIISASLEKFSTEIRGLQRSEIREVEEPFAPGQTGSSSMPHKRNPELTERICGLSRLIRGHSITALENVALWGERDISHSSAERIILPDSCLALDYSINIFSKVMDGLRVYPKRMRDNMDLTYGLVFSQRILLALVQKGLTRENAYNIVQTCSMRSWEEQIDFPELIVQNKEVTQLLSKPEIKEIFNYSYYIRYVDDIFEELGLS